LYHGSVIAKLFLERELWYRTLSRMTHNELWSIQATYRTRCPSTVSIVGGDRKGLV